MSPPDLNTLPGYRLLSVSESLRGAALAVAPCARLRNHWLALVHWWKDL